MATDENKKLKEMVAAKDGQPTDNVASGADEPDTDALSKLQRES